MISSFITLLRRELWEHNSLRWMPLLLLLFILLANFAFMYATSVNNGLITIVADGKEISSVEIMSGFKQIGGQPDEAGQNSELVQSKKLVRGVLFALAMIINIVLQVMMIFYLLDSLYGERKDYSILFWKSLPLSDTMIVLSKLVIAAIIIPAISLMTMMLAQMMTLALQSYNLTETTGAASLLWQQAGLMNFWKTHFILLVEQSIWVFPVMGWLLLCSVWSRRSPFIPAIIIPLLLIFVDSSFRLDTNISEIILERGPVGLISDVGVARFDESQGHGELSVNADTSDWWRAIGNLDFAGFVGFLSRTKVWLGFIIGLLLVGMTIWLRRRQGDNL